MSKKSKTIRSIVKTVGVLFGVWIVFSWIHSAFSPEIDYDIEETNEISEDVDVTGEQETLRDTAVYTFGGEFYTHDHKWSDNSQNEYQSLFKVHKEYLEPSTEYRENFRSNASWTMLYDRLVSFDTGKLDDLIQMYDDLKEKNDLSQKEFADMVVTSIQNIPYVLVHEYSHAKADRLWGGYIKEYHKGGRTCLEKIKFGVQSPVEFMCNFKGDCDTRALLCYMILKEFGFDVAMLGSETYAHEVLGISGNYRGGYVKHDGVKYYAWETTATGYSPGVLSADCSNMDYWTVDICSKD